jgi:copper chaperone CopZ
MKTMNARTLIRVAMIVPLGLGVLAGCEKQSEPTSGAQPAAGEGAVVLAADYDLGDEPLAPGADETLVEVSVKGMTCNSCANAAGKAICTVPGVRMARVSLDQERAWVVSKAGEAMPADAIVDAIEGADFESDVIEGEPAEAPDDAPAEEPVEG